MDGKTETDISNAELINGLQHMADDHSCCKDTIRMTIDQLEKLERENAALREDKERLDWLERYHLSLSRLTSPDMSGLRFVGQCFNPAKEQGKGGPSYLKIEGSTIRSTIDAARKEAQP